jgi:GDPmannose 4,6-dehydratase
VKWVGERGSVEEHGVDVADESKVLVRVDPSYFRPTEVELLIGKSTHC